MSDNIKQELEIIKEMITDVNYQMQELREAIRGTPSKDKKLPVRELYQHPWYSYKRQELIASGNYHEQLNDRDQGI